MAAFGLTRGEVTLTGLPREGLQTAAGLLQCSLHKHTYHAHTHTHTHARTHTHTHINTHTHTILLLSFSTHFHKPFLSRAMQGFFCKKKKNTMKIQYPKMVKTSKKQWNTEILE